MKCKVCGEETTGTPEYSFHGKVHKWGPKDHPFEPETTETDPAFSTKKV
jgi:hypothetical protein